VTCGRFPMNTLASSPPATLVYQGREGAALAASQGAISHGVENVRFSGTSRIKICDSCAMQV
jgi:hypothetical protein